ncbi:hypothetical protein DL96DRAFT_1708504 [Flagelloscypha sp. PMI_526]|nr:hypothetical protein DL96DRAFT_1708504 [Flagelloscypha sp. PMI_526]
MPRATRSSSRNPDADWTPSSSRKSFSRAKSASSDDSNDNADPPSTKSRNTRTHSGEKKFHCPFPGTSRKDNLNQHYRIHLGPGSRSSRSRKHLLLETPPEPTFKTERSCSPPPLECPPLLEDSRVYFLHLSEHSPRSSLYGPVHTPSPITPHSPLGNHSFPPRSDSGEDSYTEIPSPDSNFSEPLHTPSYHPSHGYFSSSQSIFNGGSIQDPYRQDPRYTDYPSGVNYSHSPVLPALTMPKPPPSFHEGQNSTFGYPNRTGSLHTWRRESTLTGALG